MTYAGEDECVLAGKLLGKHLYRIPMGMEGVCVYHYQFHCSFVANCISIEMIFKLCDTCYPLVQLNTYTVSVYQYFCADAR